MFIPAEDGSPTPAPIACAMVDDLALALRDTYDLPSLKLVFDTHERASGGRNNWLKTFLMRIGSLRGSTAMPPDWSPAHANFDEDPIRYLGAFFGTTAAILSRWLQAPDCPKPDDLTSRMRRRLALWSSFGVGPTYAGRNLILKNSVLAMAWYLTEAQTIPSIDSVLTSWQRMAWIFLESSATTLSLSTQPLNFNHASAQHDVDFSNKNEEMRSFYIKAAKLHQDAAALFAAGTFDWRSSDHSFGVVRAIGPYKVGLFLGSSHRRVEGLPKVYWKTWEFEIRASSQWAPHL